MSIFRRPHYTSEITSFIEEMKEKKPTLEAEQRAGRALLWDKHLDRSLLEGIQRGQRTAAAVRLPDPSQVMVPSRHPSFVLIACSY